MKTLSTLWMLLPLLAMGSIAGCQKENVPHADFSVRVEGQAPHALLYFENRSQNAIEYEWLFSEGASDTQSYEACPTNIRVDKKGILEVTLIAKGRKKSTRIQKRISIEGENAIIHYRELHFGYSSNTSGLGRCFSISNGSIYPSEELSIAVGRTIDFVFCGDQGEFCSFVSPTTDWLDIDIPGGRHSEIITYKGHPLLSSLPAFTLINDARVLDDLSSTFVGDQSVIDHNQLPALLLFRNADGKKGLIWVYEMSLHGFRAEVKVQKY